MITVTLARPQIDGEIVRYGWQTSHPIPHQPGRTFEQRYEGIDLAWFAPELFLEIFLAFELKALGIVGGPVRLVLPSPVPAPVADFWRGYHNAWNVEVGPLSADTSYDPWAISPAMPLRPKRWGVFFGGGKDSSFVAQMVREVSGADDVLLLRGIYDGSRGQPKLQRRYRLDEVRLLAPNRQAHGFSTATYHTTFPQTLDPLAHAAHPHRELHTAGALPLLLAHRIGTATISIEWGGQLTSVATNPPPSSRPYGYRSGPAYLASQSRHYQRTLGTPLTITNPVWPLSFSAILHTLNQRYPAATRTLVSCERPVAQRWCSTCAKCQRMTLLLLGHRVYDPDYDFSGVLVDTPMFRHLATAAQATPDMSPGTNAPWSPDVGIPAYVFHEHCDAYARIDRDDVRPLLSAAAMTRLETIVRGYGNVRYPHYLQVSRAGMAHLPTHVRDIVLPIVAAHLEVVDDTPDIVDPTGAVWAMAWRYEVALAKGMPA